MMTRLLAMDPAGWSETFRGFSPLHGATLLVWACAVALLIVARGRARRRGRERSFDRGLGWALLAAYMMVNIWWAWPGRFEWARSIPIHVCDLAALFAPLALLTGRRWPRTLLYFWGLGLSSQGMITPVVRVGLAYGEFWMFWINHGVVIGAGLYDVIARGYRPTWRDWGFASCLGLIYIAALFGLDAATGWNYGYVGPSVPEAPTIVDGLGAWPLRVVWIVLIALAAMALLVVPWEIARRLARR